MWQSRLTTQSIPVRTAGRPNASYFTAASLSYLASISDSNCRVATILANPTIPRLYLLRAQSTRSIIFSHHRPNSRTQTSILLLSASDQMTTMPYVMSSTHSAISPLTLAGNSAAPSARAASTLCRARPCPKSKRQATSLSSRRSALRPQSGTASPAASPA